MNSQPNENEGVVIIGSSNMDFNVYSERLPNPGETVTGGVFQQALGGKGANQAVAAARSGSETTFIGKVGKDAFGDQMITNLSQEGIDTAHIIRDPTEASGIAFILIDKNGENMISVAPGANAQLKPQDIETHKKLISKTRVVIAQMEIPLKTLEKIYEIAQDKDVIKILNPAPLKPLSTQLLEKIDIIIPNEGELLRLNSLLGFKSNEDPKIDNLKQACLNISGLGINHIITTLGAEGSLIYDSNKNEFMRVPSFKVKAIDTVGAGDCFNGVLSSMLSKGKDLIEAVKYATCGASIAVTRKGAQESMPFLEEIEARIEQYDKNIKM
ncbi:MAG: ribokinase [Candidatus Lokiarchaeota archaeon]|nr:ribokinase [Candidatus Lokiarchaeota archaeon]MBD3199843.1 ribokinase [Candidatus Lokiarchaeota archaeon]